MKVYKLVVCIIDFNNIGEDEIVSVVVNTKYPNRCISPQVMAVESCDIGERTDNNPLNFVISCELEFNKLFNDKT